MKQISENRAKRLTGLPAAAPAAMRKPLSVKPLCRAVALLSLALAAPAVHAGNHDATFYENAERLFSWAEKTYGTQLLAPTSPVTDNDNGYYFRCYQSNLCLGVKDDGYVYFYDGKSIRQLNSLDSYLNSVDKTPVRLIGALSGKFADDAAAFFDLGGRDVGEPLFIGDIATLGGQLSVVRDAIAQRVPVVLLNASQADIDQLRLLVGLPAEQVLPSSVERVDAYAVDTDSSGNWYDFILLPDVPEGLATATVVSVDPTTGQAYSSSSTATDTVPDDATLQSERFRLLADWLAQDGMRNLPSVRSAAAKRDLNGFAADAFTNLEDAVKSTESRMVWRFRKNVHTLTTNVWSVHNRTVNEDWFLVRQQGLFSASNDIHADLRDDKGRFTSYYAVDSFVEGWENNPAVYLSQSSPATIEKTAKASSSVTWSLSGELNASAKASDKPEVSGGGKFGVGVSVNNSYSYDIPDVTLTNLSGTQINNAGWSFNIAKPYYDTSGLGCIGPLGWNGMGAMSQMSRGTFQPVMQWVWRVSPEVRKALPSGLPLRVNFKTRVGHIYYNPHLCGWALTDWSQDSSGLTGQMSVPWPPL
ncbi:MAG: hypothetical protein KGZ83_19410 [Sulfuricella sp.]|nr:hypothetical protein [Sulfuricella sp.]